MTAHTDLEVAVNAAQDEYDQLVASSSATSAELARAKAEVLRLQAIIDSLVITPPPPPPPPVTGTQPKIPFKPPTLVNPQTIDLSTKLTGGITLPSSTQDYILKLPTDKAWKNGSGLNVKGGHNVVIIGGVVDVGDGNNGARRAGYFQSQTGVVHVEGVRFGSSTQATLTEGLNIHADQAEIQFANLNIATPCAGSYATNHADLIQTWGGPRALRVFGFKGRSNYQAMFLDPMKFGTRVPDLEWTFDRIDVTAGAYTLWQASTAVKMKIGAQVHAYGGKGLWKPAMWPGVKEYAPTEDFVLNAGLAYTTPSYL